MLVGGGVWRKRGGKRDLPRPLHYRKSGDNGGEIRMLVGAGLWRKCGDNGGEIRMLVGGGVWRCTWLRGAGQWLRNGISPIRCCGINSNLW